MRVSCLRGLVFDCIAWWNEIHKLEGEQEMNASQIANGAICWVLTLLHGLKCHKVPVQTR